MLDGFVLKRLFIPCINILFFKNNNFNNILFYFNFNNIYNYIYYCFLYYYNSDDFKFYIGDTLDLETIFIFKSFFSFKSCTFINFNNINRNILNSDLRSYFLINTLNFNLYFSTIFFIFGSSLRKELPILNIKLKNFVTKFNFPLVYIGSSTDFSYKILHFDFINKNFIYNFFFCKSISCRYLIKYSFPTFFFLNFNYLTIFIYLFNFLNLLDFIDLN